MVVDMGFDFVLLNMRVELIFGGNVEKFMVLIFFGCIEFMVVY